MPLNWIADDSIGFYEIESSAVGGWIDIQVYRFVEPADDAALIQMLLDDRSYDFTYAGPRPGPDDPKLNIHGPYIRSAISVGTFHPIAPELARARIEEWTLKWGRADYPRAGSLRITQTLERRLPDSSHVYELDDIRDTAEHEWGMVVGVTGYQEYVSIDQHTTTVALVVASDD